MGSRALIACALAALNVALYLPVRGVEWLSLEADGVRDTAVRDGP